MKCVAGGSLRLLVQRLVLLPLALLPLALVPPVLCCGPAAYAQTARSPAPESPASPPAQAADPVDFARDVFPLLRKACFECHGAQKQEGDLRLDHRDGALGSGTIAAGKPEESELIRRIALPAGDAEIMPARGKPLAAREVELLRTWIAQGSDWPERFEAARHWAYERPRRPALPTVSRTDWPRNALDAFVLRRLEDEGLGPAPPADPETLLRRVYLDLIGLPPSPAEVDAFVRDPSEQAYEQVVDDLLRRAQFGERWARPWLDLARYADSHGFQRDDLRDIWAYRDWVIQALNADMPFDQFTIEQVGGDLLPEAGESQKVATGFHRCTPTNVEAGSLPEETRIEQVIDRVNTTGAVWLGVTLECAQCHDHKYDPFTMRDYYRLLAFFNSTRAEADRTDPKKPSSIGFQGPSMPLSNPQRDAERSELQRREKELRAAQAARREELAADLPDWAGQLAAAAREAPRTTALEVLDFQSEGTTDSVERLDDGSVLLLGEDPPGTDVYTLKLRVQGDGIRALRLDALTDDRLPGKGPGRGDGQRANFVLNTFEVARGDQPLAFRSAQADFSQQGWDVAGAVDDDPRSGWAIAPRFGQSHWALFVLEQPLDAGDGLELTVRLVQQFGNARTIGRFRISAVTGNLESEQIAGELVAAAEQPAEAWSAKQREQLLDYRLQQDAAWRKRDAEITRLEKQRQQLAADTTLVMIELDKPRDTHLFQRGDYRQPGEPVQPGTPGILHPMPEGPANRLTLARWLVDPENPLVARVTVNRWWAELFGQGIVPTVEDFGIKGDPPSHPELLDWLAVEFVERGWSMKHLLRTMVLSSTYRQSSRVTDELLQQDPDNRLLARGPRFRMSAEMIRDNALAVSGLLSLKQFGPPIRPYQPDGIWTKVGGTAYDYQVSPGEDRYRRGIYVVLKRGAPYPSFVNFDGSARLSCTVKRSRTNTPLQALNLLNDPVYVEAARALAGRVLRDLPEAAVPGRLEYAFQLCTARRPDAEELRVLSDLYAEQLTSAQEHPAEARTLRANFPLADGVTDPEFAAWYAVATTLLNLHETITRP